MPITNLQADDLQLHVHEGEPRVLDTDLAARLGMLTPANIRTDLIEPNRAELEGFGILQAMAANSTGQRGRPSKAFYLNEEQATLVVMFSRTLRAAEARREIIAVFQAYRRGELEQAAGLSLQTTFRPAKYPSPSAAITAKSTQVDPRGASVSPSSNTSPAPSMPSAARWA